MNIEYEIDGKEVPFDVFRDHVRFLILEEVGNSIDDDDEEGIEMMVRDEIHDYELRWERDNEDRILEESRETERFYNWLNCNP